MRPLAILLAASLPLLAQAPPPQQPMGGHHLAEALGLSPEQQAKMKSIHEKHAAALKADREALRTQAQAFKATLKDAKADPAQLRQAFDQASGARFQMLLEARAMRQEMRAVLTPEQQAKADAMKAAFHARRQARMERRIQWMQKRMGQGQ
jgi:Spy/CpxP family protein refolding chaperone